MGASGQSLESAPASPVEFGATLAGRFTVGERYAMHGDLHLHQGRSAGGPVRVAAFKYSGSEPLPRFIQGLEGESELLASVRHGNLVPTLESARIHGTLVCYRVIEEPGGRTLADRLAEHPRIAPEVALHITLQIARALDELHQLGVVHSDLDPANVHLLGPNNRVRVAWPGLAARVEHAGMNAGRGTVRTLTELSPEALDGAPIDARSDVYSLGALLYRMLAGQPPFTVLRRGGAAPGVSIGADLPELPDHVPAELAAVIDDLLQRDPGRRPPSVADVLFTLQELEPRVRAQPVPPGVWIPSTLPSEDSTPPSLDRTVVPSSAVAAGLDPALSNTPVSASSLSSTPAPALRPRAPLPAPATGGPGGATWLPVLASASLMSLLVLVGVVALASLFGPEPAPAPAPVVAAPQPAPAPPPALAAPAILTLRTDPPGAEVWEGDVRHGLTPLELVLTGGPVDEPRELVLKLDGYAPHTVRQPWTDRSVQHSVALQRVARPEPKRPTRPSPALPVREER